MIDILLKTGEGNGILETLWRKLLLLGKDRSTVLPTGTVNQNDCLILVFTVYGENTLLTLDGIPRN